MQLPMKHRVQRPLDPGPVRQRFRQDFAQPIAGGRIFQLLTGRLNAQTMHVGIGQSINDVLFTDPRVLQLQWQVPTNYLCESVQDLLTSSGVVPEIGLFG